MRYDTIEELMLELSLYPNKKIDILEDCSKHCRYGWFAVAKDGNCALFDKTGELDDISKVKSIRESMIPKDIEKINVPDSVTSIWDYAFYGCSWLTSVTIPASVKIIGNGAFSACIRLTNVVIPNSVKSIGAGAFMGCSGLTSMTIPNSVTSIRSSAFYNCIGLDAVMIPDSVKLIKYNAFDGCNNLKTVYVKGDIDKVKVLYDWPRGIEFKQAKNSLYESNHDLKIHYRAHMLDEAFAKEPANGYKQYECIEELQMEMTLYPQQMRQILDEAGPQWMSSKKPLWFIVTKDGKCNLVDEHGQPNDISQVKVIERYMIPRGIEKIDVPSSVNTIAIEAFNGCDKLSEVKLHEGLGKIEDYGFYWCNNLKDITMPSTVYHIGASAFEHCASLQSIEIPKSIKMLFSSTFSYCVSLEHIKLPSTLTYIPAFMFTDCSKLTSIDIPNNVECIGDNVFRNCHSLTSLTIPAKVKRIGRWAFEDCTALKSIHFKGKKFKDIVNMAHYPWALYNIRDIIVF